MFIWLTFFDTAEIYGFGESERLLGQFCQQTQQPVQIATKYFPLPWRWNRVAIVDALTASLDRLRMSRICLYQIHWPLEFLLKTQDFMEVLAAEVKKGRIQAVGVSNCAIWFDSTKKTKRTTFLRPAVGSWSFVVLIFCVMVEAVITSGVYMPINQETTDVIDLQVILANT